jgi:hypothetical protein
MGLRDGVEARVVRYRPGLGPKHTRGCLGP